jgi:hypothetical protein
LVKSAEKPNDSETVAKLLDGVEQQQQTDESEARGEPGEEKDGGDSAAAEKPIDTASVMDRLSAKRAALAKAKGLAPDSRVHPSRTTDDGESEGGGSGGGTDDRSHGQIFVADSVSARLFAKREALANARLKTTNG